MFKLIYQYFFKFDIVWRRTQQKKLEIFTAELVSFLSAYSAKISFDIFKKIIQN